MDADVTIEYNSSQKYNITENFGVGGREIMCFSYIVDQILADTSTQDRQKTTLANILSCFITSTETWRELNKFFDQFIEIEEIRGPSFKASYEYIVGDGIFGKYIDLEKEYQPRGSGNLDGKLSVSTTLYAIHLAETLSSENADLMLDVLSTQMNYYQANGYPSWGNRMAPAEALESVLRY